MPQSGEALQEGPHLNHASARCAGCHHEIGSPRLAIMEPSRGDRNGAITGQAIGRCPQNWGHPRPAPSRSCFRHANSSIRCIRRFGLPSGLEGPAAGFRMLDSQDAERVTIAKRKNSTRRLV
jgi:hypothetical protein